MVSSSYENLGFDSAVASMYTADSTAKLIKTTINAAKKATGTSDGIAQKTTDDNEDTTINYFDENSAKSIAEVLKGYTEKSSRYIREMNAGKKNLRSNSKNSIKDFESYTKDDYDKAGMSGYYTAKFNLNYSKALTNYMKNYGPAVRLNTFSINI